MIDDLITRGTTEPYRMFTSRAEYRLLLREDNADLRLTAIGRDLGLVDDTRWHQYCRRREAIEREQAQLENIRLSPEKLPAQTATKILGQPLLRETTLLKLLRRPEISYATVVSLVDGYHPVAADIALQVEVQAKYHGYIERQQAEIERSLRDEHAQLPMDLDYARVRGLSNEAAQKLNLHRPLTLGQASRIPGITPAAISLLRIHLKSNFSRLKETA